MTIQILLTLGLVVLIPYAYAQRGTSRLIPAAMTTIGVVGLYFVWLPDHANDIAHLVGVGRGADLVLYCWIIISLIAALNLHIVARSNLRLITELARHIALSEPRTPVECRRSTPPGERSMRALSLANDKDPAVQNIADAGSSNS